MNGEIYIRKRRNVNKTWVPKSYAKGLQTAHKIITVQNKAPVAQVLTERTNYFNNIEKYNKSNFKLSPTREAQNPPTELGRDVCAWSSEVEKQS